MKTKTGKLFLIYCAVAVVIASAVRFFQYASIIDFGTGFFIKGSEPMGMLIYIILCIAGLGLIGLTILGAKKKWTAVTVSSDGMGSKSTIIPGVGYLIAAVISVMNALNMGDAGFFRIVSAYAVTLCFAAIGLCLLKSTVPPAVTGFINLFLALYFFISATQLFTDDLTIKNRSDNLILLFIYVLGTLFFASSARFYARLETKLSRPREIIMAGFAFILSSVHVLSKLLVYLFGKSLREGMSEISLDALVIMVISGAFLITVCTAKQHKEIDYLLPEKKEEKNEEADDN